MTGASQGDGRRGGADPAEIERMALAEFLFLASYQAAA